MKLSRKIVLSKISKSHFLPQDLKSVIKLLDAEAKVKFMILSSLQILLALLEVVALGILTVTITIGLNSYTNISKQGEEVFLPLNEFLSDLNTEEQIATMLATYVVLTITKTLLSAITTLLTLNLLANQAAIIGYKLNRELFEQDAEFIKFGKSQENLAGVTYSLDSLLIGYLGTFSQLAGDVATILMVCGALVIIDLETSLLLFLLFASLLIALHRFVNVVAAHLGEKVATLNAKLNRRILDVWLVYREILLAQKVDGLLSSTHEARVEIAKSRARLTFLPSLSKYIFEMFLIISALVVSSVQLWINGINDAVSSFILMVAASTRLLPALMRLQSNILTIKQSIGSGIYARTIIQKIKPRKDTKLPIELENLSKKTFRAEVIVKELSYTYPNEIRPALKDLTFSVTPGTLIAVTGSSGSGKTTLMELILGFLEPSSGSILINGMEPKAIQKFWPGKIAYVPQDVQIIEGSIAENISLKVDCDIEESKLSHCIESSGLLEYVKSLDDGLRTQVGERGQKLSGGQKQRLGIARALYGDPEMLILDEATSSLDAITESIIAKNIFHNASNRTVIVIAHRLSTVMNADLVLYFSKGALISAGKFDDLKKSVPEFLEQAELSGL